MVETDLKDLLMPFHNCPRNFCDKREPAESVGSQSVTRFLPVEQDSRRREQKF